MRNYLRPRRLAEVANPSRVEALRRREEQRARQEARTEAEAREIAEALTSAELRIDVKSGPQGTLFGSVTPSDIADEIWRARRIRVDRRKIGLDEPIKRIGRYDVPVEIFQDVRVDVKTLVVPEGGELPPEEELEAASEALAEGEAEEAADAAVESAPEATHVPADEPLELEADSDAAESPLT